MRVTRSRAGDVHVETPGLTRGEVARYVLGWVVVAAASWGSGRTRGPAHVALVVVCALLALYLVYLGFIHVVFSGLVALTRRLVARRDAGRRPPSAAWWIVIGYWILGVLGPAFIDWFGYGLRGDEAWWPLAGLLVGGLCVTAVFGWKGWRDRRP